MALKKLRDNLQKKHSEAAKRGHSKTAYDQWSSTGEKEQKQSEQWQSAEDSLKSKKKKAAIWGALTVCAVLLLSLGLYFFVQHQRSYFQAGKVSFVISSISEVESNQPLEISFSYTNDTRATLTDARIQLQFDEYFLPEESAEMQIADKSTGVVSIGDIPPMSSGETKITGRFIAPQNEVEVLAGTLHHGVSKKSDTYEHKESVAVTITSSPLVVDILAQERVIDGNDIELSIAYRNKGTDALSDLGLEMTFPEDFSFIGATPAPHTADKSKWVIGELAPNEKGVIIVRGILRGDEVDVKNFGVQMTRGKAHNRLGYAFDEHSIKITQGPLVITQKISKENRLLEAGESAQYSIQLKNTSDVPMRNIILRALIDGGDLVEYENLLVSGNGFYDAKTKTIEWKAVNIPELANLNPGESALAGFSIPLKEFIPIKNGNDKDFVVKSLVTAESPDFPSIIQENKDVLSNTLVSKVSSKILHEQSVEVLSGPLPLKVGEPTRMRVTLGIGSVNNQMTEVSMLGSVSTGVRITRIQGEDNAMTYNERTNQFAWNVGKVHNATGVLTPLHTLTFDIEVIPSLNSQTDNYRLLENLSLRARDQFTGERIEKALPQIYTESIDRK